MEGKPRVLIVEDDELFVRAWKKFLDDVEIIWARTILDAERIVSESLEFALIVVDCCVPGDKPNTQALVRMIRKKGFTNPIIAKSGHALFSEALMKEGATHRAMPWEVPSLVRKLLFGNAARK